MAAAPIARRRAVKQFANTSSDTEMAIEMTAEMTAEMTIVDTEPTFYPFPRLPLE